MKKNYTDSKFKLTSAPTRKVKTQVLKMTLLLLTLLFSVEGKSQYCNSAFTSVTFEFIKNVTYGGINNNSLGTIGGPVNYTSQVANVTAGIASNISITIDDDANDYVYVFIDWNQNSVLNDPGEVYTIASAVGTGSGNMILPPFSITPPLTALAGTTRMRVMLDYGNATPNPCRSATWGEAEDYSVFVIPLTPCTTTPTLNTIVSTTAAICPNASTPLSLASNYTTSGIYYQWTYSNLSAFGPFTVIPTPTTAAMIASPNLSVTSWFQLNAWCVNGGGTLTTAPVQVSVSPVITSNVPYYEGFEGITVNNQLPNCSWSSTGGNAQTYTSAQTNNRLPRTGNKFASVYGYNLNGTNYYYTNGINMYPGITYSASVFYVTEYFGYTNFQELSIKLGTTQTPTGLVNIVTQSVVASNIYKELTNTFTVPTPGLYYVAIKVVSAANAQYANYLSWDDLSITIPCQLNTPTVSVSATSNSICSGQSVTLTAIGATTYTWDTGATTSTIIESPTSDITYTAMGTNTLTNCKAMTTKNIIVKPTPVISIIPSATVVCEGSSVNLVAMGATSFTWGNSNTSSFISVSPAASQMYSVSGTYANSSCIGVATQMIMVNTLPNITALSALPTSCPGQNVNLSATLSGPGAATFQWIANSGYVQGSPVVVNPMVSTTYTVTGTDENGCSKSTTVFQTVVNCTGINEHAGTIDGLSVYPNPNNGDFTIELNNGLSKTFELTDVTGRVLLFETNQNDKLYVNMNDFANGIYYVKVKSNNTSEVLKVVKQ